MDHFAGLDVSVMITTFQVSSWGATEMARPVGHSQISSISSLMADSSSSRVFAGFFKRPSLVRGAIRDDAIRAGPCLKSGRESLALR